MAGVASAANDGQRLFFLFSSKVTTEGEDGLVGPIHGYGPL